MIGQSLKMLRTEKGLSQRDIASAFGISQQAYCNYEADRREPDFRLLCRIADYFGVTLDYLLGRDDTPQPRAPLQPVSLPAMPAGVLNESEQEVLSLFRSLNDEGQTAALATLRGLSASPAYIKSPVSGQIQEIG